MKTFTPQFLVAGFLVFGPVFAQAPAGASPAGNGSFRLTMPAIRATFQSYSELVELLASDPAMAAKYKATSKALPDTNGRDTMGLVAAKMLTDEPRVAAIFRKSGTTPEMTTTTFETLLGVMFGDAMLQSAKGANESKLPAFVAENLAFYRANKSAIQSEFQQFAAKAKSIAQTALDEGDEEEEEGAPAQI